MNRGRRVWPILLIAAVVLLAVVRWITIGPGEPAYNGKRLSYWLDISGRINSPERLEAAQAVRAMGTNALPFLVRMVARKDSAFKSWLLRNCRRQRLIKIPLHDAQYYHSKSTRGFSALGKSATPAVPELVALLKDPDKEVRTYAAVSLSFIGPDAEEAIPSLLPLLDERNNGRAIIEAMNALGQIHKRPEIVLPRLVEFLNGDRKDWNYSTSALSAIGRYRTDAKHLAPIIATLLDASPSDIKDAADTALFKIDPEFTRQASK